MFIPRHWSEARHVERLPGRREVTVRRFGWSSASPAEAQAHAQRRLEEALVALRAGGPAALRRFTRQERRVAYGGPDGLPIREEIVEEMPELDAVVTRNAYGALCLNTPGAMFVDVDRDETSSAGGVILGIVAGAAIGAWRGAPALGEAIGSAAAGAVAGVLLAGLIARLVRASSPPAEDVLAWTVRRVTSWCAAHPGWRVAVYETPAGVRLLALHAVVDPTSPEAREFMAHVRADPRYRRMCELQRCFRARLSPKPWRAGLTERFHAGGVWPVTDPERLERRRAWVARYEGIRFGFAACRFVREVGDGFRDRRVDPVRRFHDEASAADTVLPLA